MTGASLEWRDPLGRQRPHPSHLWVKVQARFTTEADPPWKKRRETRREKGGEIGVNAGY